MEKPKSWSSPTEDWLLYQPVTWQKLLNLIIAPVNGLLPEINNPQEEGRYSAQCHERSTLWLCFNSAATLTFLILSHFAEMVSSPTSSILRRNYGQEKNIALRYETNRESVFVSIDIIAWVLTSQPASNALKYTPAGGGISFAEPQKLNRSLPSVWADTGIGICNKTYRMLPAFLQSSRTRGERRNGYRTSSGKGMPNCTGWT